MGSKTSARESIDQDVAAKEQEVDAERRATSRGEQEDVEGSGCWGEVSVLQVWPKMPVRPAEARQGHEWAQAKPSVE